MWRDPLDELVEDLERLAPPPQLTFDYHSQFEMLQRLSDAVLYGSGDEIRALRHI